MRKSCIPQVLQYILRNCAPLAGEECRSDCALCAGSFAHDPLRNPLTQAFDRDEDSRNTCKLGPILPRNVSDGVSNSTQSVEPGFPGKVEAARRCRARWWQQHSARLHEIASGNILRLRARQCDANGSRQSFRRKPINLNRLNCDGEPSDAACGDLLDKAGYCKRTSALLDHGRRHEMASQRTGRKACAHREAGHRGGDDHERPAARPYRHGSCTASSNQSHPPVWLERQGEVDRDPRSEQNRPPERKPSFLAFDEGGQGIRKAAPVAPGR